MKNILLALLGFILPAMPLATVAQQSGDFTYTSNGSAITIVGYTGPGGAVSIPVSINSLPVTAIGDTAFTAKGLSSVTIPWTITSIPVSAFALNPSLVAITVDAANAQYTSLSGVLFNKSQTTLVEYPGGKAGNYSIPGSVTTIEMQAFTSCANLTKVTIPNSVSSIEEGAFSSCTGLTNVTIPGSVTVIGTSAFGFCFSLATVTIQNHLRSIGDSAFFDCIKLSTVVIPGSVSNIGVQAFQYCSALTNITIPPSVTMIGSGAFDVCYGLSRAFFQGNAPVCSNAFNGDTNATAYYLPDTTGWGATFAGLPAVLWNPLMQTSSAGAAGFGFNIAGTADIPIVIEAATNMASPAWVPLQNLNLTNGAFYFGDPDWTNYPARFYRIRSP